MTAIADSIRPIRMFDNQSKQEIITDWEKAKRQLNDLPNDYLNVFRKVKDTRPYDVKKHKMSKGWEIDVQLKPILGFESLLTFVEIEGKGIQRAWYMLFDNEKNISFTKDVLKEPTL